MGENSYCLHQLKSLFETKTNGISFQIREKSFYCGGKKKLILPTENYVKYKDLIKKKKIPFGLSICDVVTFKKFEHLKPDFIKIINDNIKNKELIDEVIKSKVKKIFISTGHCKEKDIENIFLKYSHQTLKEKIILIHTQLSYSTKEVNLKAIKYLKDKYQIPVGYSNHCSNLNVIYMSLAFEPEYIFIYIKGNRKIVHKDEHNAIKTKNIKEFINQLLILQKAVGKLGKFDTKSLKKY